MSLSVPYLRQFGGANMNRQENSIHVECPLHQGMSYTGDEVQRGERRIRRFALARLLSACVLTTGLGTSIAANAEDVALPTVHWSFSGAFGTFDQPTLRRGFQVYKEICSNCHSMNLVHYRDLAALGYSEDEIKSIAASFQITDGPNDNGDMYDRPGRPSDAFKPPFPNEQAARAANGGALPPDLSLIVKARKGGADYVRALLTGYAEPPTGMAMQAGMNYNLYFPGHQIAMPQPISDDSVTYADGTKATVDQEAFDVTNFLAWTAEPELPERHRMGVKAVLFLIVLSGLLYAVKRKVWAGVH
jgi:ubiquinol-cytochrome c reductase cytochrome c1 subunit